MFNHQEDEDQLVRPLLDPLADLFSKTTPAETRGRFSRHLPQYFNSIEGPKYYFSFQQGPAYIIVLDSGEDKEDGTAVYAGLDDFDNYRIQQAKKFKRRRSNKQSTRLFSVTSLLPFR